MEVSVIVPTYNRRETLQRTITLLCQQTFPQYEYEIIVIDDYSRDGTREFLANLRVSNHFRYLLNPRNAGRAATRNNGIKVSRGRLILMIDDDIWVDRDLIAQHYHAHQQHADPIGVVGAVLAAPDIPDSALNAYLTKSVRRCYQEMSACRESLSYNFCKTANLSLPKNLFEQVGLFNEQFTVYGAEDTELGVRLEKNGTRLVFSKGAHGYHYHDETVAGFLAKVIEQGQSIQLYHKMHPGKVSADRHSFFSPHYTKGRGVQGFFYNCLKSIPVNERKKILINLR